MALYSSTNEPTVLICGTIFPGPLCEFSGSTLIGGHVKVAIGATCAHITPEHIAALAKLFPVKESRK